MFVIFVEYKNYISSYHFITKTMGCGARTEPGMQREFQIHYRRAVLSPLPSRGLGTDLMTKLHLLLHPLVFPYQRCWWMTTSLTGCGGRGLARSSRHHRPELLNLTSPTLPEHQQLTVSCSFSLKLLRQEQWETRGSWREGIWWPFIT